MVVNNRNYLGNYENIVFEHILILEGSGNYFVMSRNKYTKKIYIFLVMCRKRLLYERSGRVNNWQEIKCLTDKAKILEILYNHLSKKTIPIVERSGKRY
ncbi:MAG: hypothetical protein KKD07_01650 [Candidatus Omnitrophica bacterium]|nr:hypothetical protein [Candidatus Omnitrophota bacterium]MBU1996431.1 hypothetical protein [Candidatus Omnitrophota bacterium]MBU4333126.1 hypothetical protein [Candidatus Omnitrophota bacterium]